MLEKEMYELELNKIINMNVYVDEWASIRRVPGGWIYFTKEYTSSGELNGSSVFVPYSDEFKPKEKE